MNRNIFIMLACAALVINGAPLYLFAAEAPSAINQSAPLVQKTAAETGTTIVGTVIQNVKSYVTVDLPGYFSVRTETPPKIFWVTYSEGDAGCINSRASRVGIALEEGDRVEVYIDGVGRELSTCKSPNSYIKILKKADGQQISNGDKNRGVTYPLLEFSISFSIVRDGRTSSGYMATYRTHSLHIDGSNMWYVESSHGGDKEVRRVERPLLPSELEDVQKAVIEAELINLKCQDYGEPLCDVSLRINGRKNAVYCSLPLVAITKCQKQVNKLRLKLNRILGVNIH